MIQLSSKVKDKITGFVGIATARTEFLTGATRIEVSPDAMKDGVPVAAYWFDEERLQLVEQPSNGYGFRRTEGGEWRG